MLEKIFYLKRLIEGATIQASKLKYSGVRLLASRILHEIWLLIGERN